MLFGSLLAGLANGALAGGEGPSHLVAVKSGMGAGGATLSTLHTLRLARDVAGVNTGLVTGFIARPVKRLIRERFPWVEVRVDPSLDPRQRNTPADRAAATIESLCREISPDSTLMMVQPFVGTQSPAMVDAVSQLARNRPLLLRHHDVVGTEHLDTFHSLGAHHRFLPTTAALLAYETARGATIEGTAASTFFDLDRLASPRVSERAAALRSSLGYAESDVMVLQPTRVVPRKGVHHSAVVASLLADLMPERRVHFVVAGGLRPNPLYATTLIEHLAETRVASFSMLKGREFPLDDYIRAADVVASLGVYDPFGRTPAEGAAAGSIVAATRYRLDAASDWTTFGEIYRDFDFVVAPPFEESDQLPSKPEIPRVARPAEFDMALEISRRLEPTSDQSWCEANRALALERFGDRAQRALISEILGL